MRWRIPGAAGLVGFQVLSVSHRASRKAFHHIGGTESTDRSTGDRVQSLDASFSDALGSISATPFESDSLSKVLSGMALFSSLDSTMEAIPFTIMVLTPLP